MFSLAKSEIVPLTHTLAREFATMEKLPGERPLKSTRLRFFEDHVAAGTLRDLRWTKGIHRETGKCYRLDGQHTSTVLATLAPERFPRHLQVEISTWEFDSLGDDRPAIFDMFDNPKSARSNEDMMGVLTCEYEELRALGNPFAVKVAAGIAEYESTQKIPQLYPPRRRGMYFLAVPEYRTFAVWLHGFEHHHALVNPGMFGNKGIVAEMVADWKISVPLATEFWSYVLFENHPDRDHVTRELAEDLKRWSLKHEQRPAKDYRLRSQKAWRRFQKEVEFDRGSEAA
jgi:hypothetical protein